MGFWAGLARGYADADAKKEREAVRAEAEAARKEATDYARGRDALADTRYDAAQKTAAEQAAEAERRWQLTFNQSAEQLKSDREWRVAEAKRQQENIDKSFKREGEYNEREWALTLDKWDYTKDQADVAQENADRIFNQSIKAFEYGQSRDVVGDLRADRAEARAIASELYAKERDLIGDQQAAQNRQDRLDQFEWQVKRAGVSDDQWQQSFDRQGEELEIQRASQLMKLMPSSLTTGLGGGSVASEGTKGSAGVMSAEAMKAGSLAFKAEFSNLDEDTQGSEFFKAAAQSPAAQATIMAFVEAQGKKGNTVDLADVPKYFKYLGATEGKGEAEAKEFMNSVVSGDANLGDKDTFINGLMVMRNYKPAQQLFIQTDAPGTIDDASKQLPVWENAVEVDAYRALSRLEGDDKAEVQRALAMLERKENRTQGLDILAKYGYGADAVKEYNMGDNPVIKSYYGNSVPTDQPVTTPAETPTKQPAAPEGSTVFGGWDEVEAARQEGFSGVATINGTSYNIAPLETPTESDEVAPEVTDIEPTQPAVVEPEFLGTGRIDDTPSTDTPIDDMFREVSTDVVAPETVWPDRTPKRETPVDFEKVSGELESAAADTDIEAVIQDIEEIGIKWPINREELTWFKEDLKSLVYEMEIDIPDDVLFEVVKRASENAMEGETMKPQVDYPDAPPSEERTMYREGRVGIQTPDDSLDDKARRGLGRTDWMSGKTMKPQPPREERTMYRKGRVGIKTPDDSLDDKARRGLGRSDWRG